MLHVLRQHNAVVNVVFSAVPGFSSGCVEKLYAVKIGKIDGNYVAFAHSDYGMCQVEKIVQNSEGSITLYMEA